MEKKKILFIKTLDIKAQNYCKNFKILVFLKYNMVFSFEVF